MEILKNAKSHNVKESEKRNILDVHQNVMGSSLTPTACLVINSVV